MYKIRCNLIHGHKKYSPRQKNNVRIGNDILNLFLMKIFEDWKNKINNYILKYS